MSISETLIGRNMQAHPDCLGVYISLDEIYVAQTTKKDGGTVLESLVRVPVSGVDRNALKPLDLNEAFFVQDGWKDALSKITSKKKWKTHNVVVSLDAPFCLLRHFIIQTSLDRKSWKSAIPLEARKYIHFPFEKAEWAYHAYEFETAATHQKRLGVMFTMTSRTIIERLKKGLKSVGLNLISVETSALSLARTFIDADKEAVGNGGRIYSFFGDSSANFVFLNEYVPVLLREVDVAGTAPVEHRRFELTNSTEFIAKQLEKDPFEEAVITGRNVDQWVSALEADSKKPVRRWSLKEVYGIEAREEGELAAVGASLKFFDAKIPDVDFTKGNRLSSYEYNASLTLWKIVAVIAALCLLFIGFKYLGLQKSNRELASHRSSVSKVAADFQGLNASQISTNLNNMKTQNNNLEGLTKNTVFITPVFEELVDSIPDNVWVTSIKYNGDFPAQNNNRSVVLEGRIKTGKGGTADMELGNSFKDKFAAMPTISKICGNAATVNFHQIAGSGSNKETTFTLNCSSGGSGRR
ncbi:MAG: pilus assembly protein PilM [Elusimicrobiaceae bacterium]|nr:pilus assembly protein PilM [Elusimicrobiaceae bacterium]